VKKLLKGTYKKLRQLFDFNQPQFRHLGCIDLVLENKLLLLLAWDAIHAYKISIHPGKIKYYTSTSAAVCTLPIGTDSVEIILRNVWRSKKISFKLKRIAVDRQTLLLLDEHFLTRLALSNIYISNDFAFPSLNLKNQEPKISLDMQVPAFNITINQFQLNDYAP
jgi:hypothetical protein